MEIDESFKTAMRDPAQPEDPKSKPRPPAPTSPAEPATVLDQPPGEVGGPKGPEPTRYGDWAIKGIVSDF
jgi:hypothetical protein